MRLRDLQTTDRAELEPASKPIATRVHPCLFLLQTSLLLEGKLPLRLLLTPSVQKQPGWQVDHHLLMCSIDLSVLPLSPANFSQKLCCFTFSNTKNSGFPPLNETYTVQNNYGLFPSHVKKWNLLGQLPITSFIGHL